VPSTWLVLKIDEWKPVSREATLTVGDYESALRRAEGQISEIERRFLQAHYQARGLTTTATELAQALGYRQYRSTNLIYGSLAKKLQLGVSVPRGYAGIGFLVESERPKAGDHWKLRLRRELAAALDKLAWFPKEARLENISTATRRWHAAEKLSTGVGGSLSRTADRLTTRNSEATDADYKERFKVAAYTARWAVIMTKVCIRQAVAHAPFPRWHLLTFVGPDGRESRGVVDLIAIRKDHDTPRNGLKRGDAFQVILIQVKGGYAAKPTAEDARRLRIVARRHGACEVLLAAWMKGKAARFYSLRRKPGEPTWIEIVNLSMVFS
jgi:hypothetical protein